MKTYVCDLCDHVIKEPYKMNMREFFVGAAFESYGVLPENSTRKQKIHLCADCFETLKSIVRGEIKVEENTQQDTDKIVCWDVKDFDPYRIEAVFACPFCGYETIKMREPPDKCPECGEELAR